MNIRICDQLDSGAINRCITRNILAISNKSRKNSDRVYIHKFLWTPRILHIVTEDRGIFHLLQNQKNLFFQSFQYRKKCIPQNLSCMFYIDLSTLNIPECLGFHSNHLDRCIDHQGSEFYLLDMLSMKKQCHHCKFYKRHDTFCSHSKIIHLKFQTILRCTHINY